MRQRPRSDATVVWLHYRPVQQHCFEYVDALQRARVPLTHKMIAAADHVFTKPPWRRELLDTVTLWLGERL